MLSSFKFILIMGLGALSFSSSAALISPPDALKRAEDMGLLKLLEIKKESIGKTKSCLPSVIYTYTEREQPCMYLFRTEEYVLCLSADDEVTPLLGYFDGEIDCNEFPAAFKAWMNSISLEISLIRDGANARKSDLIRKSDFEEILPLCKTQWSQDAPYNDECPKPMREDKCYTGCVATAMAQVMRYHNWPASGEGTVSYKWDYGHKTLKADFSEIPFEWSSMLNNYHEESYTAEEATAVAQLMKACGYSVQMSYSTSASGAMSQYIAGALGKYFKYDKGTMRYVMRDYYSLAEWEEMIYNSLKNYGPVILDGQSNQGGHSFVCDGYDKDGYFHINWGWGGVSDGYYLLSVLDPYNQGIGGSGDNSGFNFMQDAIIGITPAKESIPDDAWYTQLYGYGEFGLDTSLEYTPGDGVGPLCEDGIYNFGPMALPADASLGILFREANEDGVEEKKINEAGKEYVWGINLEEEVGVLYGFGEFVLPLPEEIPNGNYNVTLAYQSPSLNWGNWMDVLFREDTNSTYAAIVKDGVIRFNASDWRPTDVEEIEMAGEAQPKLYFNLQGMPIQNPAKGEIVIVKEGKKSYKRAF